MPAPARTTTRSTCTVETEHGVHVFDIFGYSLHKGMGFDKFLRSRAFTVGGHRWAIRFYPDDGAGVPSGDDGCGAVRPQGPHLVFVYLELLSEGATARASCDLGLVDRVTGLPATVHATAEPRVFRYGDPSMYFPQAAFMGRAELEASPYLADDRLTIRCAVTVVKEPRVSLPPSAAGRMAAAARRMLAGSCRQIKRMTMMPLSMRSCVLRLLGEEEEEGEDERAIIEDMQQPEAGLARVMPADADHKKMVPRLT